MLSRLSIFLFFIAVASATAQDLHFSQFYHNPWQLNPAATGVFNGDWRLAGVYRSQWASVPVNYNTFALAFDRKMLQRGATQISAGLLLENDQAGDAGLRWTQLGLMGSVAQNLTDQQTLVVGAGLAFVQRSFSIEKLKFKNQWTGDVYDAALPNGESFASSSGLAPTLSAGLQWHYRATETRTQLDVGVGAAHLNHPSVSFWDDAPIKLPMRLSLLVDGGWQLNEQLDLIGFGSVQQMTKAQEIIFGAGLRRLLSNEIANVTALRFSLATRWQDAIIPAVQMERNNWTVGVSYDYNISGFQSATGHRGGFEIAIIYRHVPVPPLKASKSCPIF